jgi:tetratricopeptide (TPR) repeat protein
MAAAPDVAAALHTDPRVVQINQGDATAFQTWVAEGVANIGVHLHDVDATILTSVLERFLREQPSSTIPQNLPRSGAAAFVGRAQELARLHQQLRQSDRLTITAIAGMGGIGKTELALQYAQAHWQQGTYAGGVCWLQACQVVLDAYISLDVGTQIVQFAQARLQLHPPDELDLTAQVAFCWQHWRAGDVLVVFDDVTDYAVIQPYFPPTDPRFKVVITTRKDFGRSVASMAVNVLDPDAALELLERLVGEDRVRAEQDMAHDLGERLGYLPLGLELVGRYLARKPDLSLGQMRQRLDAKGLMSKALVQTEVGMTARLGVTAAFELSWETLSEAAQRLGCLLSVFAGAPIPWSVVEACCAEIDPEDLEETRDHELVGFNLLQRAALGVYRVHALIQEFLQGKLQQRADADALKHAVCQWVAGVARHIPQTPTRDLIEAVTPLIPHMAEVATSLTHWVSDEDLIWPFAGVSRFYAGQGDYAQAVPWCQQSLSVTQRRLGEDHPDVATSFNNLALLYQAQGRYAEAEPLLQRALAIWDQALGHEHPQGTIGLNNLAELYHTQGRYAEAEPLYQRVLAIREKTLGAEHPAAATSLNNLAGLYYAQGRYAEAEPLYQRALAIREHVLGPEHPDVAGSLNSLAVLYQAQGRYAEAEPLLQRALAICEHVLGPEYPDVAGSLNNLAGLYHTQGRYAEAEPLLQRALAIREKTLGAEYPAVATSLHNLAELYRAQGRYAEAEPYYQQALIILEQARGPEHPGLATVGENYAALLRATNRDAEAAQLGARLQAHQPSRAWLGIQMKLSTDPSGVFVEQVIAGSPAAHAGILPHDVVIHFNAQEVPEPPTLLRMVGATAIGSSVDVDIIREGQRRTIPVTLERRPLSRP